MNNLLIGTNIAKSWHVNFLSPYWIWGQLYSFLILDKGIDHEY